MYDLAVGLDIVVRTVDLDQTGIGLDIVDVVVPDVAFLHDTVLHLLGGLDDHFAVSIELIAALRHQAIGLADEVFGVLDQGVIALEVIVIAIDLDQAGIRDPDAIFDPIGIAVLVLIEAIQAFQPCASVIKHIPLFAGTLMIQGLSDAGCHGAAICIRKILPSVCGKPFVLLFLAGPEIMRALVVRFPCALYQHIVLELISMSVNSLPSIYRCMCFIAEIVVAVLSIGSGDHTPTCLQLTVDCVIFASIQLKQTGELSGIDAILAKIIIVAVLLIQISGKLMNTGQRGVIHEVVDLGSETCPAVFDRLIQCVGIAERPELRGKVTA